MSTISHAAPQRVVVVNAADDQAAGAELASELRRTLDRSAKLAPLPAGDLSRALESPLPETTEAAERIARARGALARAEEQLARFDYDAALAGLASAERLLLGIEPDDRVTRLLADANLIAGLVHLGTENRGRALRAFRAVRRLAPERDRLDPARYPPPVVELYEKSTHSVPASSRMRISAPYDGARIYVDGVRFGRTPVEVPATPGIHYVHAVYPEHRVTGERVDVAGPRVDVKLRLERMTADERGHALRRAVLGVNAADFSAAARSAASLSGADGVVVIKGPEGALETAVYDTDRGVLSDWRPARDVAPAALIAPLVPQESRAVGRPILPPPETPTPTEKPWYEKTWGRAAIGGAAAVIIGGIALSLRGGSGTRDGEGVIFELSSP